MKRIRRAVVAIGLRPQATILSRKDIPGGNPTGMSNLHIITVA